MSKSRHESTSGHEKPAGIRHLRALPPALTSRTWAPVPLMRPAGFRSPDRSTHHRPTDRVTNRDNIGLMTCARANWANSPNEPHVRCLRCRCTSGTAAALVRQGSEPSWRTRGLIAIHSLGRSSMGHRPRMGDARFRSRGRLCRNTRQSQRRHSKTPSL